MGVCVCRLWGGASAREKHTVSLIMSNSGLITELPVKHPINSHEHVSDSVEQMIIYLFFAQLDVSVSKPSFLSFSQMRADLIYLFLSSKQAV